MSKILLNASTIRSPGGVQGTLSLINYIYKVKKEKDFIIVVSDQILNQIRNKKNIINLNYKVFDFFNPFSNNKKNLKNIIKTYNPKIVYSIGFPSYFNFGITEIGRQTNGFDFIKWNFFSKPFDFYDHILRKITGFLRIQFSKNANFLETQTIFAKKCLSKKVNLNKKKIFVISNSVNSLLKTKNVNKNKLNKIKDCVCVVSDSAHYKNLKFVIKVIARLKFSYNQDIKFIITISNKLKADKHIIEYSKKLGVYKNIEFTGKLHVKDLSFLYRNSKLSFCPSTFELFSAVYIESAFFNLPIIAPNLDFIKKLHPNLCFYYRHQDVDSAADLIVKIINKKAKYIFKSKNFVQKNKHFFDDKLRNQKIIGILYHLLANEK